MNPKYFKSPVLLNDYINQSKKLTPFYQQPLYPDWAKLAGEVSSGFKQTEVLDELIAQNMDSTDELARKNSSLLKEKNTVCVVTGQQLGLMISPLYIIYKTLSTLILCERINKEIKGFNFVPVFWLEGEDHDFEEIKSLNVFDRNGILKNFSILENDQESGLSVNKRELTDEINKLLSELKENLQPTDFSEITFQKLEDIYRPGTNWLDAFKEHIANVFNGSGLLFFNAGSPKIKELSKPFFKHILLKNKELVSCFRSDSTEMEKAGFKNQVTIQEDKAYLFLSKNGPRQSLFLEDDTYIIKDSNEKLSQEEMLKLLEENPYYFSSTVLTRPLWQSWLLPTISYVAGNAEIAYWGQLSSAFNTMDLVMPQIQPRHTITLLEPKTERLASKYKIDIQEIGEDKSRFLKDYFINNQLGDINSVLLEFEKFTSKNKKAVNELVKQIDPTLLAPVEKSYSSIIGTINKLQDRLSNRVKEKEAATQNHLNTIHEALMPGGKLQERVLSSVYLENKYGPDWLLKIKGHFSDNFEEHLIVKL